MNELVFLDWKSKLFLACLCVINLFFVFKTQKFEVLLLTFPMVRLERFLDFVESNSLKKYA